jgi:hypothetical protein
MTKPIQVGDLVKIYDYGTWRADPIPIGAIALVVEKQVRYRSVLVLLYRGQRLYMSSKLCTKVPE